ncbi:MAG: hypothetical protein II187_09390 [Treponema sp.]|jgi:hypothetical protein|nr:hypothetical protein [Treponema sp.]
MTSLFKKNVLHCACQEHALFLSGPVFSPAKNLAKIRFAPSAAKKTEVSGSPPNRQTPAPPGKFPAYGYGAIPTIINRNPSKRKQNMQNAGKFAEFTARI